MMWLMITDASVFQLLRNKNQSKGNKKAIMINHCNYFPGLSFKQRFVFTFCFFYLLDRPTMSYSPQKLIKKCVLRRKIVS